MVRNVTPTRDVQRLQVLRNQLAEEKEKRKEVSAERSDLKRRLGAAEKVIKRLETSTVKFQKADTERKKELIEAQQRFATAQPTVAALVSKVDAMLVERAAIEEGLVSAHADSERKIAEEATRADLAEADLREALDRIEVLSVEDDTVSLIKENRRIAGELEIVMADFEKYREAALASESAIKQAREETEKNTRAELEEELGQINTRQEKQIKTLTSQLKAQGKTPLMSSESAANLVQSFVGRLRNGAAGLRVKDGEIRLKVAFGSVGKDTGFLIPTAENDGEFKDNLHEIVLRFDQAK